MDHRLLVNRNKSIMPFLMHCMNILCVRHPELKNHMKMDDFFVNFLKKESESLEEMVIRNARDFLTKP